MKPHSPLTVSAPGVAGLSMAERMAIAFIVRFVYAAMLFVIFWGVLRLGCSLRRRAAQASNVALAEGPDQRYPPELPGSSPATGQSRSRAQREPRRSRAGRAPVSLADDRVPRRGSAGAEYQPEARYQPWASIGLAPDLLLPISPPRAAESTYRPFLPLAMQLGVVTWHLENYAPLPFSDAMTKLEREFSVAAFHDLEPKDRDRMVWLLVALEKHFRSDHQHHRLVGFVRAMNQSMLGAEAAAVFDDLRGRLGVERYPQRRST